MRILLSSGLTSTDLTGVGEPDLHTVYGRDWLSGGGLRVNFVSAVDGAVSVNGLSGGLQTPGDNRVFAALRDLADVVVAGSATVMSEGYRPVSSTAEQISLRKEHGLGPQLPIAVVSRSLKLDPTAALFTGGPDTPRTLILTCGAGGNPQLRRRLAEVADLIDCGDDAVDLSVARAKLVDRGLGRILCEGGPRLFAQFAEAGVVDELCLSLSPVLAGPGSGRITAGDDWTAEGGLGLSLYSLLEEDSALFLRYRTTSAGTGAGTEISA